MKTSTAGPAETWDLAALYPTPEAFESGFEALAGRLAEIEARRGVLGSAAELAETLAWTSSFHRELGRLHTYAMLRADSDMRDGDLEAHRQRVEMLFTRFSAATSWLRPALLALPDGTLESYLESEPRLAEHRFHLTDLLRFKPHVLTEPEEKLLADAGLVTGSPADIYQTLLNAEMPWPTIETPGGESVRVTPVEFQRLRTSPDRAFRRRLYERFLGTFESFRETMGQSLYGAVKAHVFNARARGHDTCLAAALHRNDVPVRVYDGLIERVHDALPLLHRYQRLRARALGLERLESHDLYCPLAPMPERSWTPAEATADVLASTTPLGEAYGRRLRHAFESRWIDWRARDGKRVGAYSAGSAYDAHPYVLLNYNGDFDAVSTLAHEMGHAMHSDFSNREQPFPTANYSIFVAEVASTVNEALLAAHLLERASDDDERLFLLTHRIDSIRGTLFRQSLFAEFEREVHGRVEAGDALTGKHASEIYESLLSRYHGWGSGAMAPWPEAAIEWAAVPHFHYNFYVYQYATGIVAAEALSQALLSGDRDAAERYLRFLGSGGSAHPLDLLRLAGVDLETDEPYRAAFRGLEGMLDELEALLDARPDREQPEG